MFQMRHTIFLIFTLLFLLPTAGLCAQNSAQITEETPLNEQYQNAKQFLLKLQGDGSLGDKRENWIDGARNYKRIYLLAPQTDYAPACLFTLGRMYQEIYHRFNVQDDLTTARSYHRENIKVFPEHRLADDSLYAIAESYLTVEKDEKKASEIFQEVIDLYPHGDMKPRAEKTLATLQAREQARLHNAALQKDKTTVSNKTRQVYPIKYWSSETYSRVVVLTSGPVRYQETLLAATKNQPRRLYIDFQKALINTEDQKVIPVDDGLLKQVRSAQFNSNTVRVVLDLDSISNYKIFSLPDPFRIIIDVHGERGEQTASSKTKEQEIIVLKDNKKRALSSGKMLIRSVELKRVKNRENSRPIIATSKKSKSLPPASHLTLAQQLGLGVRSIIIDAGHGGKDPGAIAGGLKEKDITLAIAQKLKPKLEEHLNCKVILTRDTDKYISLEERTALANTSGADLFISLHINAHNQASVKGLETYYLNFSTNDEAMRVAARENATSTYKMSDLQGILSEIMNNSKINESARLAEIIHNSIYDGIQGDTFHKTKDLGVKKAPFYVLIGAEMPAILIELGFITNKNDRENLSNENFQDAVVTNIATAIEGYINDTTAANF